MSGPIKATEHQEMLSEIEEVLIQTTSHDKIKTYIDQDRTKQVIYQLCQKKGFNENKVVSVGDLKTITYEIETALIGAMKQTHIIKAGEAVPTEYIKLLIKHIIGQRYPLNKNTYSKNPHFELTGVNNSERYVIYRDFVETLKELIRYLEITLENKTLESEAAVLEKSGNIFTNIYQKYVEQQYNIKPKISFLFFHIQIYKVYIEQNPKKGKAKIKEALEVLKKSERILSLKLTHYLRNQYY